MQVDLFPSAIKDQSLIDATVEYEFFKRKGLRVHLVLIKSENRYSVSINSKEFIQTRLKNTYEIIK